MTLSCVETLQNTSQDLNVAVLHAVGCMSQLLEKVMQLSEDMKGVTEIAAQIHDISTTLTILENAVAKLAKEKKEASRGSSNPFG